MRASISIVILLMTLSAPNAAFASEGVPEPSGSPIVSSPDMVPVEIYKRAVTAMHAIVPPEYLQFDTSVTTTMPNAVVLEHERHIERTRDRSEETHDVDATVDNRAEPFEIAPDLFLGHPTEMAPLRQTDSLASGLDVPGDTSLKTIAAVSVTFVHYEVSFAGTEDLSRCAGAIHLKLDPVRDPLTYNLRDLWVNPSTSHICEAVAVWRGHVNWKHVVAPIALELDESGYITHFSTSVRASFLFGGTVTVKQECRYSDRHSAAESEWSGA